MTAPTLDDVRQAAARIAPSIRRTPLIAAAPARERAAIAANLLLKLESLQVSGSFKARGASNKIACLSSGELARGVVTASGGNHGLAVACAGWRAGVPTTIYLPRTVSPDKLRRLDLWGAEAVVEGEGWDDSHAAALATAARDGRAYVHPFADPLVIAGQGTVATEILDDDPAIDTLLVAIGGGGLIGGVAIAARAIRPGIRIVGVEPTGAPTMLRSLEAGRPSVLDRVDTAAGTLAPRSTDALNYRIAAEHVERIVLVTDGQMREAARWLWAEQGVAAELSGAASVAALLSGHYAPQPGERVCAVVCGAGADGMQ